MTISLLRFLTAGSVDDGKSTLIGRLLYDCRALPGDTLEYLERSSNRLPDGSVNLALLTDGLRAEREQGITIDIAHKYFATKRRKFIIADAPGHVQYTRNMVTGASNSDLVVLLVDARHGVIEQTRRHAFLATLLGIRHLVVAVNKMDLIGWDQEVFGGIQKDFQAFEPRLAAIHPEARVATVHFIPLSALRGDNVVERSTAAAWYCGPTLLDLLESAPVAEDLNSVDPRFPVQYVIRPQSPDYPDYRGFAGRVASGRFAVGQEVVSHPSGLTSRIKSIDGMQGSQKEAFAGQSVTITLEDEIDLSRGDTLALPDNEPEDFQKVEAWICWMDQKPGRSGAKYLLRQTSRQVRAMLESVESTVDISSLDEVPGDRDLKLNDIARVEVRLASPLPGDSYARNRKTGAFILIDEGSNQTVAAGVILGAGRKDPEYSL